MRNSHSTDTVLPRSPIPLGPTSGNANWNAESAPLRLNSEYGGPNDFSLSEETNPFGSHLHWLPDKNDKQRKVLRLRRIAGALSPRERSRYRAYRLRARKDIGKDGQEIWSDKMEEAFQIGMLLLHCSSIFMLSMVALRRVPPVLGKMKVEVRLKDGSTKQCGRNEIIALVVEKLTSEPRFRKQISSHIQVINGFLNKDRKENGQEHESLCSPLKV